MPRIGRRASFLLLGLPATMAAVVIAGGTNASPAAGADSRPNVVVIMTDDQTVEAMRVMQRTRAAIGDAGATFANAFVNLPLCCPSRATFLTGLYAHNHGVTTNSLPGGGYYKFNPDYGSRNLATALQGAGYHTALVGKYMNEYGDREPDPAQVPPGWSEWYAPLDPEPETYGYRLNENGATVAYGTSPADYKTDVLTSKALGVITRETATPDPLFMWLSYTAPHGGGPDPSPQPPYDCDPGPQPAPRHATAFDGEPLPQPPNFNEADVSDKPPSIRNSPLLDQASIDGLTIRYRCTLESLLAVDEGVQQVIDALRTTGELENTLIMFTSDNGFFFGEHRDDQGKGKHYDPSTRVPLLIRGPGIPAGTVPRDAVVNADLTPTIVDAARAVPPGPADGYSLLSLLSNPAQWTRTQVLLENRNYAALRTQRYVYAEHSGGQDAGYTELYEVAADPYELQNLHGDPAFAGVEADLAQRLAGLRSCAGPSCSPPPDTSPPSVAAVTPGAGAVGLDPSANITVAFSELMDKASAEAAFSLIRTGDSAPVPGAFSWKGTAMTFDPSESLGGGAHYTARVSSEARDLAQNRLVPETTWELSTHAARAPDTTQVDVGAYRAGAAASLASDDDRYYEVNSTTSKTRTTTWQAQYAAVPNGLTGLKVTYKGKHSRSCTQQLRIRRWTDGVWVKLDSRTVGGTEVNLQVMPSGSPGDYVSGTSGDGELRFRVTCATSNNFTTRGDLVRLEYNVP